MGDELNYWYTASVKLAQTNLFKLVTTHPNGGYHPMMPFMAGFPSQIFSYDWLKQSIYFYPLLIPLLAIFHIYEKKRNLFWFSIAMLIFALQAINNLWIKQLTWNIFYGESIAMLGFLILMTEGPILLMHSLKNIPFLEVFLFGSIFVGCALTKPALSSLALIFAILLLSYNSIRFWRQFSLNHILFLIVVVLGSRLWSFFLIFCNQPAYYRTPITNFFTKELILNDSFIQLIKYGLFSYKFLFFTTAVTIVINYIKMKENKKTFFWQFFLMFANISAILLLYATVWSTGADHESGMRYISQSLISFALLLGV